MFVIDRKRVCVCVTYNKMSFIKSPAVPSKCDAGDPFEAVFSFDSNFN